MPTSMIHSRVLSHAVNLRHGTNGFTSPPKEGVLRIFSPLKIRRLRPGFNPQTWVLKANTLPPDHRSRLEEEYSWSRTLTQSLALSDVLYQPVVIIFHIECLFDTFTMTDNSSAYTDTYTAMCMVCRVCAYTLYKYS